LRKYGTFDCETDPFKFGRVPKPFLWGLYTDQGFEWFKTTEDFIDRIKNFKGILYAHNGGKFDFHFLFDYITPQDKIMVINGRIAKMKIGDCELRDSYLLLPVPLSAYKKDEIDYEKFEEYNRKIYLTEIVSYLHGDCKYLYDILSVNFEDYGQKLTLATSAFNFWHKNYAKVEKPQTNRYFFEHFKPFYYGGRVQCFQKGIINKPFKMYDINSAYPFAMKSEHPYGTLYKIESKLNEKDMERKFIRFKGISNGVLPYREKGKLLFPTDNSPREYFATGWELRLGLEKGLVKINKIERVYNFTRKISFGDYVDHFFKLKAASKDIDDARYLLAKLYMNSLYGKFGQSSLDHKEYTLISPEYISDFLASNENSLFEGELGAFALMSVPIDEKNMKFFNVCTAASITGFVRAYLYDQILKVKNPIYCDTDCVVCEDGDFNVGKELGQWGFEGNFRSGAIGGKKLYAFEYEVAKKSQTHKISSKGVKLNAKQIYSIARGEEIEYKNDAPSFSIHKDVEFLTRNIKMT
jgi:hypothetical protein